MRRIPMRMVIRFRQSCRDKKIQDYCARRLMNKWKTFILSRSFFFFCLRRWTASLSSSRATEFCTGRRRGCPRRGRGRPRTWRFPRRGPSCSRRWRKASCTRSKSDRTSTSFREWTANPKQRGPPKNVRSYRCMNMYGALQKYSPPLYFSNVL